MKSSKSKVYKFLTGKSKAENWRLIHWRSQKLKVYVLFWRLKISSQKLKLSTWLSNSGGQFLKHILEKTAKKLLFFVTRIRNLSTRAFSELFLIFFMGFWMFIIFCISYTSSFHEVYFCFCLDFFFLVHF